MPCQLIFNQCTQCPGSHKPRNAKSSCKFSSVTVQCKGLKSFYCHSQDRKEACYNGNDYQTIEQLRVEKQILRIGLYLQTMLKIYNIQICKPINRCRVEVSIPCTCSRVDCQSSIQVLVQTFHPIKVLVTLVHCKTKTIIKKYSSYERKIFPVHSDLYKLVYDLPRKSIRI